MDGRRKAYPPTVLVQRQTLWITTSYANWVSEARLSERLWGTKIMRAVCRDVQTVPALLSINKKDFERRVNTADNARLDICARGLWNNCEKMLLDIRITHPTSQSYSEKIRAEVYQQHEKDMDKYNQRVIDIENSSFNSFVVTTSSRMTSECTIW